MPELAEVEHSRRIWNVGIGYTVVGVIVRRPEGPVFRGTDPTELARELKGKGLLHSEARGKQMLFSFESGRWLGIHLGMTGALRAEQQSGYSTRKHDYLALEMSNGVVLVFEDQRLFGRIRFDLGQDAPEWWRRIPPSVTSKEFTRADVADFLQRRKRTPIKAVLLMQERFPGIGNWMADEILWRARIAPHRRGGALVDAEIQRLYKAVRWVAEKAITTMDQNWDFPRTWLFPHRWAAGGHCPRCNAVLKRATVGGRTSCWCPVCQPAEQE